MYIHIMNKSSLWHNRSEPAAAAARAPHRTRHAHARTGRCLRLRCAVPGARHVYEPTVTRPRMTAVEVAERSG